MANHAWYEPNLRQMDRDAEYARLRDAAAARFATDAGPCPGCGGPARVDVIDVTGYGGDTTFIPGLADCAASCYVSDPQRYLDGIRSRG